MRVAICGLGYVGATTAACLLKMGHAVVGVDVNAAKTALFAAGRSPVSEPGVEALLAEGLAAGRLAATVSVDEALRETDIVIVCVGTPSRPNGELDLSAVLSVARGLGEALRARNALDRRPLIVVRSTLPPGSMDDHFVPAIAAAAGEPPGERYEVAYNPEFLRESTAVADFFAPSRIVIGERAPGTGDGAAALYDGIEAPRFVVAYRLAEMIKLVDNTFHAMKVAFANEVGRIATGAGVDPSILAALFVADTKLNISPKYLLPGGAFGGSCLPKDVRAMSALASRAGIDAPIISRILASNAAHKQFLAERVLRAADNGARLLLVGLSFKSGSDDLRESPLIDLAEHLIGKGFELKVFDPDLLDRTLVGANLAYVRQHLPHLSRVLVDSIDGAGDVDLVVIGKSLPQLAGMLDPAVPTIDVNAL